MITFITYLVVSFVLLDFTWFDLLLLEENKSDRLLFSFMLILCLMFDSVIITDLLKMRKENE